MTLFYFYFIKYKSTFLIPAIIIISALIISFSNRFMPSPVKESFVIDSWTGDIYDTQGNNLTVVLINYLI